MWQVLARPLPVVLPVFLCVQLFLGGIPARAGTFTMAEAVERALRDNNRIAASQSGIMAAESGVKAARGAFGPAVGTSYSYDWSQKPGMTSGVRRSHNDYSWNAGVTQNLFNGFKDLNTWQRAALEADRQRESLRSTRLDVAYQVQSSYLQYLTAVENIRSASDSLDRLRSQLEMTRAFFNEGLRPRLDVLQAEVDVSRAESILIQAENNRVTQQARLNSLLGLGVIEDTTYTGALDPVPFDRTLETFLESAYRQRPDLRMAALSVDIAGKDRAVVQSEYYPQLSAGVTWSTEGDTLPASGGKALDTRYSQWTAGLVASWTLFSWGTTYHADVRARHLQSQLRAEERDLREEAGYEVKSRLLNARNAEKRIAVAVKAVEQATEAYHVAVARYQSQLGTNIDVLDAQSKLTTEEANLTAAKADYLTALASLYTGMGEIHPDLGQFHID